MKRLLLKQLLVTVLTGTLFCGLPTTVNAEPIMSDVTDYDVSARGTIELHEELGEWLIKDIKPENTDDTINFGEGFVIKFYTNKHDDIRYMKGKVGKRYVVKDEHDYLLGFVNNSDYIIGSAYLTVKKDISFDGSFEQNWLCDCGCGREMLYITDEYSITDSYPYDAVYSGDYLYPNKESRKAHIYCSYDYYVTIDDVKNGCAELHFLVYTKANSGDIFTAKSIDTREVVINLETMTYTVGETVKRKVTTDYCKEVYKYIKSHKAYGGK